MVLGKRWLFSIGNGAEIRPLVMGRKFPELDCTFTQSFQSIHLSHLQLVPKSHGHAHMFFLFICSSFCSKQLSPLN